MIERIIKRDGSIVPYDRERITLAILKAMLAVGSPDRLAAEGLAGDVERVLLDAYGRQATPSVEDIQDIVEDVLMKAGHTRTARSYIIYRHQRAQVRAARALTLEVMDHIPYKKIYEVLLWNMDHGCESVPALNDLIARGGLLELIRAADERFEEEIGRAVAGILARIEEARLVIVAGPSSSGKTTTTILIGQRLEKAGFHLRTLTLDNYFFSIEQHPADEFGDRDYETPEALDLELINRHMVDLLAGKTVKTPHYEFKTGQRRLDAHEMRLGDGDLLLIDSLHGLHADMTRAVPREQKVRIYVETLGQFRGTDGTFVRWADNRLMRRMIRDRHFRNLQPMQTLAHWHYVRRSELKNIIPFIAEADGVINTALPYELPILKSKLFACFGPAVQAYRDDPRRQDAFIRARRIEQLLAPLTEVVDDACVPPQSLLREFIGGSAYSY